MTSFRPEPSQMTTMLDSETQRAIGLLSADRQNHFYLEHKKRSRSVRAMVILAVFFPIQLFFLRKIGLGVLFWLTAGGLGVWWIIEWFLTPGRVKAYNNEVAKEILDELTGS